MTLLKNGNVTDSLPILKWLLAQQNSQGGFGSTQDTVVGLQALANFAEHIPSVNNDINLVVSYPGEDSIKMKVNPENSMILQSAEVLNKHIIVKVLY